MWPLMVFSLAAIPEPQGNEATLLADTSDGVLDQLSLLDASLIASGVPDSQLEAERDRLWALLQPAMAAAQARSTPKEEGQSLLAHLHATLLRRYLVDATDIHQVSQTGDFNCLSSAIIYALAAERLFSRVEGMMTPRHAFVRVWVGQTPLDVETTIPSGFGVDRNKLINHELLSRVAAPGEDKRLVAKELRDAEAVPLTTLIAGIYANRSTGLMHQGKLDEAAIALDRATKLANGSARERFATWRAGILNQSAAALAAQGQRAEARQLLELALQGANAATSKLITTNLGALWLAEAQASAEQGDWGQALQLAHKAQSLGLTHERLPEFIATAQGRAGADASCDDTPQRVACWVAKATAALERHDASAALTAARSAVAEARTPSTRSVLFFALQEQLAGLRTKHDCLSVERVVSEMQPLALDAVPAGWRGQRHVVACWAEASKTSADANRWREASQALEHALRFEPDNASLRRNLALMEVNQSIELGEAGRCDDARALIRQATTRQADVAESGHRVLEGCWSKKVKEAHQRFDWAQAVVAARRLVADVPTSEVGRKNLSAMLTNLAQSHASAGRCAEAKALMAELAATGAAAETLRGCR